ncbi:MAG TPA: SRPBCC family protein [Opitutaceae bacterium]|nr:SRPBCC family protein [Opitutaceae bacterium]
MDSSITPTRRRGGARGPVASSKITVPDGDSVKVVRSCTIMRPAAELYAFWREVENLAQIIKHPCSIVRVSDTESRWSASVPPGDRRIEWTSLVINDEPPRLIAWRTAEGAEIAHAGSVRFEPAPGDEGTEVTVALEYNPPGGQLAALLAKITDKEAGQQVAETLRRFKALMEAGEIPTIEGQPAGNPQDEDAVAVDAEQEDRP